MHEISSSYLDCLQYRDGFLLLVPNIWLVHIIYCLSFFCPLHFEFHNEMFSSVSNKLFKIIHLAFATTGSLFSSKTHSAKDFYIIKVQIWIVQFVYDCITIFWTFSKTLILFSFFIFFMFSLVSNLKFKIFKSNFKQKYIMVRSVQLHHNFLTLTFSVRPWHYLFCLYNMI